jgi:CubicO group peptidase (beta-lactamase class C family)
MTGELGGSDRLAERLVELLGRRHPVAAAAVVGPAATGPAITVASCGADLDADYEIASISKGITGLLYADALARQEVRRDSTLGELLPLGDVAAARVRLESLSTHRSGLPRLPASARPLRALIALFLRDTAPYGEDVEQLLTQARGAGVGREVVRYSNFGFLLLGHALASAAGTTYPDLVRDRLADPLGLTGLYVPGTIDQLRPTALTGRSWRGRPRQAWVGEALGPAGGIRASILDMAHLAAALLNGTAAGASALEPVAQIGWGTQIGAGWLTSTLGGRAVTWHDGGTGGFRSWLGLDRTAQTGVIVLSATAISVARHGHTLLAEQTETVRPTR